MSTTKFTETMRSIHSRIAKQVKKIDKRNLKKIGAATGLLVTMPIIVQASSLEQPKPADPLSTQSEQKLAQNLAKFSPTAKVEPVQVEIKVAPAPEPPKEEPAPEPAPEPEAPQPAPVRRVAKRTVAKKTQKAAVRSTSRKSSGKAVVGYSNEQCVPFARELSGVQVRGYAGDIKPNTSNAEVGSVALFAGYGHAAVVTGVNSDSVTVKEANYVPGKITERTVPKSQLRGYVN